MSSDLISNEEILAHRQPHALSFWPYYFYFFWYIVGSGIVLWKLEALESWIRGSFLGFFGSIGVTLSFLLIWWGLMIIPALIFSIHKIKWGWVFGFILLASLGTYLFYRFRVEKPVLLYSTIGLGILGLVLSDIYRRSHEYYLTTFRIITRLGFLGSKTRQLPYSQITDLMTNQGFLGSFFNYGSIVPATSSDMGTGNDEARVQVGAGGGGSTSGKAGKVGMGAGITIEGGKTMTVPRSRSYYILYGIPNPDDVENLITEKMREKEPAHQIDTQTRILGKKIDQLIEERDEESKK